MDGAMSVIDTRIQADSEEFRANRKQLEALVSELRARTEEARQGGGRQAVERHHQLGKLPARERIERLLDPQSPFLELSPLAAFGMYGGEVPSAGIVTG